MREQICLLPLTVNCPDSATDNESNALFNYVVELFTALSQWTSLQTQSQSKALFSKLANVWLKK